MIVAITGHRPDKLGNDYDLTSPLIKWISNEIMSRLIPLRPSALISGMALGVDMLFAEIALELQRPLIAAIPCIGQEAMWPEKSQNRYKNILANPLTKKVMITEKKYEPGCMQKRNQWMVDNCNVLISVWDGSQGGTANCTNYAFQKRKPIITINPKDYVEAKKAKAK